MSSGNSPHSYLRLRVDEDDHSRIKSIAADSKMTIQELLATALNDWLSQHNHRKLSEPK